MDWSALQVAATEGDLPSIKANLPIVYVLERSGFPLTSWDGAKAQTACPFHADSNPSFDVYGEDLERWGCYPCSLGGDVLDLVKKLYDPQDEKPFAEVLDLGRQLIAEKEEAGWTGPTTGVRKEFDWEAAKALVQQAQAVDPLPLVREFLDAKETDSPGLGALTAEWLVQNFRLGVRGDELVIPYEDRDGNVVSYKHRTATTKALSPSGSGQFDNVLYGEWRDPGDETVLLCEGESDVWVASKALPDHAVMGLPTGAGAHPKQAGRLAGRKVILAFDGDKAGMAARLKWYAALVKVEAIVLIAPMPDGYDLAQMMPATIREVVRRARAVTAAPSGISSTPLGYVRPGNAVNTPLTNWTFEPRRELLGTGASAYEGVLMPSETEAVLSSFDLASKARITGWSTKNGGAWYGADRDAQLLLGVLQAQGPFLQSGRLSTIAGLHEDQFLWPGGRIGSDHWVYVAPATDVHLGDRMNIKRGDWEPEQIVALRDLHLPSVTDPMLAWLAAAPLRSLLREFPILAVTGSSGSGKTTLLETVVKHFSGCLITNNLTATTRHSVFSFVGCTNAFPVWFDEYRPGARKDALETLNQLLRDAYTAQGSSKGGMGENWAEVNTVSTSAPLIVSGEDAFAETSHTERMCLLALPPEGRNKAALDRIKAWEEHGLAHAYLGWLYTGLQEGWLPEIRNFEAGPEDLPNRQRLNLGVLHLGWALLSQFVRTFDHIDLGAPDFSLVIDQGREASQHNPIKDALIWALDEHDAADFATVVQGEVAVRVENFVAHVNRAGVHTLPGGHKAVVAYLKTNYGAAEGERVFIGRPKRALVFDAARLLG